MGPGDLAQALEPLPLRQDARLIVGRETFDDAGVFLLTDDLALVQTVDFFAPIVDDPFLFGQIAAANALSDVYAMGGEPLTAMNILAFPSEALPLSVMTEILRGGQDKVHEAGAIIVGGHTVVDDEVKYGLSVTGRAHPARLLTNAGARVGEQLVLTKPIGSGILATLAKRGELAPDLALALLASMRALNAVASRAGLAAGAKCATDITGFGLLGHASHIARASSVTLRIRARDVPLLPGAHEHWASGKTGGASRNAEYLATLVQWNRDDPAMRALLVDPQTSGGLLVSVPPARLADYLSAVEGATVIGEVEPAGEIALIVD